MTLLFINMSAIWGGGEQWTLQSALEFNNRGYTVKVIARAKSKLIQKCAEQNIMSYGFVPERILTTQKKQVLRSVLNNADSLMIITNSGRDLGLANYIKKNRPRTAIVFRRGLDRPLSNNVINRVKYKSIDQIIVNSAATQRTMRSCFPWFPQQNIHLVYNSIDSRAFLNFRQQDIRQVLHIPVGAKVLGIIGRLAKQKGHRYALEILQRLKDVYTDIYLLIVGNGEEERWLKKRISGLKVNDHCRLVGHVDQIQPYYQACDVIIIPSVFEGFCYTAIEAQLLERPVVAFNTSSLPEVIQHNHTGFLSSLYDSKGMARKVQLLLDNPDLRLRMGQEGRKFVENNFSITAIYYQLGTILNLSSQ
jgi:glycosyltransferase involved in cell wall biosynthesis